MKVQKSQAGEATSNFYAGTRLPKAPAYVVAILGIVGACYQIYFFYLHGNRLEAEPEYRCRPPLPNLFALNPPTLDNDAIAGAAASLDKYLAERTTEEDIDSLVVAVGTTAGPLWFGGYGAIRANESLYGPPPDLDTIYRLASITKMFVVLDTLILRDQGLLSWDDPIDKYIPSFSYRPHGWHVRKENIEPVTRPPITFRQLACHLSGLGRDYPPINIHNPTAPREEWNYTMETPTMESILHYIRSYPLVAPQNTYPIYSNTGFNLLGWANLAASQHAPNSDQSAETFAELMKRDIFDPVGMNSSFFVIPPEFEHRVAVSQVDPKEADLVPGEPEAVWPSGAQASSARDLLTLMSQFLAPSEKTILSPTTIDEWFRPLHVWSDGLTQVGASWEILRLPDTGGGTFELYAKSGNLAGFHTHFAVNRATGYGVVVLMTGKYTDASGIAAKVVEEYFHPVFKTSLAEANKKAYAGTYKLGSDEVVVVMDREALWVEKLTVNGSDILKAVADPYEVEPVSLWPTGDITEFRLAYGRPWLNNEPRVGCEPYWVTFDAVFANDAPLDLVYFEDNGDLTIPAFNVSLPRAV